MTSIARTTEVILLLNAPVSIKPIIITTADHKGWEKMKYQIIDRWKNNYLDRQQASLMRDSGSGYLIDLSQLLTNNSTLLRKRIQFIKRNKDNAIKRGIPVVASSFATDSWGLRDPYGLAGLLNLIEIYKEKALDMISINPNRLVERNRAKLKDSYIVEGVWVIKDE